MYKNQKILRKYTMKYTFLFCIVTFPISRVFNVTMCLVPNSTFIGKTIIQFHTTKINNDVIGQTIRINQKRNLLKSVITPAPESQSGLPGAHQDLPLARILSIFLPFILQNIDLCLICVVWLLLLLYNWNWILANIVDILLYYY